jgi:hypothetical protein
MSASGYGSYIHPLSLIGSFGSASYGFTYSDFIDSASYGFTYSDFIDSASYGFTYSDFIGSLSSDDGSDSFISFNSGFSAPIVEPTPVPARAPTSEPTSTPTAVPVMVLKIAQKLTGFPSKELWTSLLNIAFRKSVSDLLTISLELITNTTATDILDTSNRRKLAVVGIFVNYNITTELAGSDTTAEVLTEIEETLTETTTNSTTGATTSVFVAKFMDVIEEEAGAQVAAALNENLGLDQLTTSTEIEVVVLPPTRAPTPAPSVALTSTSTLPTGAPTLNSGSTGEEPVDNTGLIIGITIPIVILFSAAAAYRFVNYNACLHRVTPSDVPIKNMKQIIPM